ncbi:MAG: MFS transporter [Lachnospiraceae bacterium]|nr:MFS transporter [Lachnospiraceae bacterium]
MEEKRYLKWYNKIGYGQGDIAGNAVYAFINSFVMIYLTDTVGLNVGIIGTLIMLSKFADGLSDIIFGRLMDKTKTKMGKARPWMLYSYFGNAAALIMLFTIPSSLGEKAQYAYFFIAYTMLNAVFYTANNISYGCLTALVTKNGNERVQMGSIRYIFSMTTNIVVSYVTIGLVTKLGGGAAGWRNVAILYAVIGIISNTIAVFAVKELPQEELEDRNSEKQEDHQAPSFLEALKIVFTNKYYFVMVCIYVLMYVNSAIKGGAGTYFMTYIFRDTSLLGTFSLAFRLPTLLGMVFTPFLVKKFRGMYKVNFVGNLCSVLFLAGYVAAGYMRNVPLMLAMLAAGAFMASPLTGTLNALVAAAADYTYRKDGKRIDGMRFSCSSFGAKIGSGLGTAISGWLLSAGGYVANAAQQPDSAIRMLNVMYLWIPFAVAILLSILTYLMKVEKANADWDREHVNQ